MNIHLDCDTVRMRNMNVRHRLEATEMQFYRKIMKIGWEKQFRKKDVLHRVKITRGIRVIQNTSDTIIVGYMLYRYR